MGEKTLEEKVHLALDLKKKENFQGPPCERQVVKVSKLSKEIIYLALDLISGSKEE